jgi:hypothetical protein
MMVPGIFLSVLLSAAPQARPEPPKPVPPQERSLTVRVLDDRDRPLPEATVRVFASPMRVQLTDPAGTARFEGLPQGTYRMNAAKGGFRLAERTFDLTAEGPDTLEVKLPPAP